jgi:hypothetical protein
MCSPQDESVRIGGKLVPGSDAAGHELMSLVKVRFRKFEGVADKFEARFFVLGQNNLDDVKSGQDVGVIEQLQPGQCAA